MAQLVVDPIPNVTYIHEGYPDTNFGTATTVACGFDGVKEGVADRIQAFFRCDISSIPAGSTILSTSKFELYITTLTTAEDYSWWWTTAGWDENTLTWNTQPGTDSPALYFTGPSATGWFTLTGDDLRAWLQSILDNKAGDARWELFCSALANQDRGFYANSDDAASDKPKLTVDYTPPAVVGYMTPRKYWGA